MGLWELRVLPLLVEGSCGVAALQPARTAACAGLYGRVLELGVGRGLNAGFFPAGVMSVAGVEPNDVAWRRAVRRFAAHQRAPRLERVGLDAQSLLLPDASIDSVLTTFTLCSVPDHDAALAEAFRVLKPGGRLHVLEHGLADSPGVRRWQHRLDPVQRRVAGGCHLTRRPDEDVVRAGFDVQELHTGYLPGPAAARPFGFIYRGVARKPG